MASACFAVGSMRSGANQSATGRTTHGIRPMKMRRGKRTGREMSAPTASAARSSASVGASGARPGNFARVSSNIEIILVAQTVSLRSQADSLRYTLPDDLVSFHNDLCLDSASTVLDPLMRFARAIGLDRFHAFPVR